MQPSHILLAVSEISWEVAFFVSHGRVSNLFYGRPQVTAAGIYADFLKIVRASPAN